MKAVTCPCFTPGPCTTIARHHDGHNGGSGICTIKQMHTMACRGGDNPPPFSFGEMLLISGRCAVYFSTFHRESCIMTIPSKYCSPCSAPRASFAPSQPILQLMQLHAVHAGTEWCIAWWAGCI